MCPVSRFWCKYCILMHFTITADLVGQHPDVIGAVLIALWYQRCWIRINVHCFIITDDWVPSLPRLNPFICFVYFAWTPVAAVVNGFVIISSWWGAEVIMDTAQTLSGALYREVFLFFYHPLRSAQSEVHTLSQGNAAWPVWEVRFLYQSCLTTSPLVFKLALSFETRRHCSEQLSLRGSRRVFCG